MSSRALPSNLHRPLHPRSNQTPPPKHPRNSGEKSRCARVSKRYHLPDYPADFLPGGSMSSRRLLSAVLVAAAVGWGGIASADMSRNVIAAFHGELVITKGELPEGKNDKDTIAKIKAERLKELTGEAREDVVY